MTITVGPAVDADAVAAALLLLALALTLTPTRHRATGRGRDRPPNATRPTGPPDMETHALPGSKQAGAPT